MSDKLVFLWDLNYMSPDGKALESVCVFPEKEVFGKPL